VQSIIVLTCCEISIYFYIMICIQFTVHFIVSVCVYVFDLNNFHEILSLFYSIHINDLIICSVSNQKQLSEK